VRKNEAAAKALQKALASDDHEFLKWLKKNLAGQAPRR
jgi:hypothetical protein